MKEKNFDTKLIESTSKCTDKDFRGLYNTMSGIFELPSCSTREDMLTSIKEAVSAVEQDDRAATEKEILELIEGVTMKKQKLYENIMVTKDQAVRKSTLSQKDKDALVESIMSDHSGQENTKLRERVENLVENKMGKSRWSFPVSRMDTVNANRRRYSSSLWEHVIGTQKQLWEGSVGLADHPEGESDPSFKDSAVIWSNLRMDEANKLVWADAVFVGDHGRLAEDILESGGKVGFSTAGLGDLRKVNEQVDGSFMEFYDVIPEEFILERVADIVPNPSQDVFGFADMKIGVTESSHEEGEEPVNFDPAATQKMRPATDEMKASDTSAHMPVEGEEANIPEDPTSHDDYDKPDYTPMEQGDTSLRENEGGGDAGAAAGVSSEGFQAAAPENAMKTTSPGRKKKDEPEEGKKEMKERVKPVLSSFEERRAYEDITRFIDNASKMQSPHDRLSEYKEIRKYLDGVKIPALQEELETRIQNTQQEIHQLVETGAEFKKIFGTDLSAQDVQGAMANLNKMGKDLKEASYDWKKVSVKMAEYLKKFVEAVNALKERPTIESHENLKKKVATLQESLRSQIQAIEKAHKLERNKNSKDLTKAHDALRNYIKESKAKEKELMERLKKEKKKTRELYERMTKLQESTEQYVKESMSDDVKYLFDGAEGAGRQAEEYRAKSRALTESANGKYLSESKREVKEYVDSLLKKHGSSILPHLKELNKANNYQEAVDTYMRLMDARISVDSDTLLDMDNPMIYEALMEGR